MIGLFQYYRIVAAYLILLIHQQFWVKSLALGRLTGVAVPLFAAMAGFLLAKKLSGDFDLRTVLIKKTRRILIPYVIWAVVYWVANGVVLDGIVRHEEISIPGIRSWLLGGTACHLWFLPCLFLVFVLFSLGWKVINHVEHVDNSTRSTRSARLKIFAFDVAVLVLAGVSQFIQDPTSATFAGYVKLYLGRLVFYFALGSLLGLIAVSGKVGACAGMGMVLIGCGNVMMNWVDGLVWSPLLLVTGLILVAKAKPDTALPQWVGKLADASMGIYLVHVLFTSGANFALQKIWHSPLPAFMGFALSVVLFAASFLAVRLLPKKCF